MSLIMGDGRRCVTHGGGLIGVMIDKMMSFMFYQTHHLINHLPWHGSHHNILNNGAGQDDASRLCTGSHCILQSQDAR